MVIQRELRQEESDVDHQHDDAGEIGAWKKGCGELAGAHVDCPRTQLRITVRTNAIGNGDKSPAVRAHPPFFQVLIVAAACSVPLLKSNSHEQDRATTSRRSRARLPDGV